MFIRNFEQCSDSESHVITDQWESVRLVLKSDNMGFSFHITTIYAGANISMHYKHHLESVYCMSGEGEIEDLETKKIFPIKSGTIYCLDKHDRHILRANTEMKMACVFNPPITGREVHDETGAYPLDHESK